MYQYTTTAITSTSAGDQKLGVAICLKSGNIYQFPNAANLGSALFQKSKGVMFNLSTGALGIAPNTTPASAVK